jgi:thiosulfate reductase cytochrome b subunit
MENVPENNQGNVDAIIEQNKLLRQNLELSQEILNRTIWIKKYLKWQQVMGYVKILIIIIPIIIGLVYLPPLLKGYFDQLSSLYK